MTVPRISVVIPTRHRNDLLALALDRLAPGVQTLPADQYEVIVTDDGSDTTAEAMVRDKYPWVRWTPGPRRGPAANRNHGACLARGEWIAFTDDDCLPEPGWLEAFSQAIVPGIDVYEGRTVCRAGVPSPMFHSPTNGDGGWLWSCNMMVRTAFFRLWPFDEDFPYPHMEDTHFRERLKAQGGRFNFVGDAIVDHPPRPILPGRRSARYGECEVIFHYKMGREAPGLGQHLWTLAKFRGKNILLYQRWGVDSLRAMYHTVVELLLVARHYNNWKRKHRPAALGEGETAH